MRYCCQYTVKIKKMKRNCLNLKFLLTIFCLFNILGIFAQNIPPTSLYAFDKYNVNSAYGGLTGNRIVSLNVREQWLGIPGYPKYYYLTYSQPVYRFHGGAGMGIKSEYHGIQNVFSINMTYNYVASSLAGLFSFGIGTGIVNISNNSENIITPEGIYTGENSSHNDEFLDKLLLNNRSFYNFSVFGMYNYENIEIGIIFDKKLTLNSSDLSYGFHDLIKFNWQYIYGINKDFYVKIFGLIQSDFILLQSNFGFTADYKSILAGINVRGYSPDTFDSMSIIIGGNINSKLRIIYAYDISFSSLRSVEDGTHEFKITYDFGNLKNNVKLPVIIFNPRL